MAISPPSDIVLDVARAAEPQDVEAARAALLKRAGGTTATFSVGETGLSRQSEAPAADNKFKRFEAMVLQTFIQNMLPKDAEGVYGKGLAGDMWKSQLAERLADVMAERGGIGIAKSMLADHYMDGKRKVPVGPVSGGPGKTELDEQSSLAESRVQQIQLRIARALGEERAVTATKTESPA